MIVAGICGAIGLAAALVAAALIPDPPENGIGAVPSDQLNDWPQVVIVLAGLGVAAAATIVYEVLRGRVGRAQRRGVPVGSGQTL